MAAYIRIRIPNTDPDREGPKVREKKEAKN
jgi:hypothetical protein